LLVDTVSTAVETVDYAVPIPRNPLIKFSNDNMMHDIKEFLSRPIICPSGTIAWTTLDTQNTNLMNMSIPSSVIGPGSLWGNKLSGFLGFKGTLCVKLQVNCQRFQSGILLLSVLPATSHISSIRRALIESDITYKSQLPSVRYNIAELDEVQIKVPFVSPELYYNRTSGIDWSSVYVSVYSPLFGGDVTATCWCWFEDVELFEPTAQSGYSSSSKPKRRAIAYADQEDEGGMISTPLNSFSRAFGDLANNIPSLSSVARPTQWFLSGLSKAAAAFGFSSTVDTETRKAMVVKSLPHMNNTDTNNTSDSLGMTVANKVAHISGFAGTDVDEMSMQYMFQIPSYVGGFSWPDTATQGTPLYISAVHPGRNFVTKTITPSVGAPIAVLIFPPIGYIGTSFQYWRGSIKYRFFANKTDFHTGRIMFTFAPSTGISISGGLLESPFLNKWIWDLSESYSFEIMVPFVCSTPWASMFTDPNRSIGLLTALVLNRLNAPPTVASSVPFLVEVSGGPDFEVSGYVQTQTFSPIMAYSGPINTGCHRQRYYEDPKLAKNRRATSKKERKLKIHRDRDTRIYAQGPLTVEEGRSSGIPNRSYQIDNSKHDLNSESAMYTIGESIKSLRQVLKRAGVLYSGRNGTDETSTSFNPFTPYLSTTFNAGSQSLMPSNGSNFADNYAKFTSMFALRRGGVIIKYMTSSNIGVSTATLMSNLRTIQGWARDNSAACTGAYTNSLSTVMTTNHIQSALDVLVPYYAQTISSPVLQLSAYDTSLVDSRYYSNHFVLRVFSETFHGASDFSQISFFRETADDFSLGGFLGVLPLYTDSKAYPYFVV